MTTLEALARAIHEEAHHTTRGVQFVVTHYSLNLDGGRIDIQFHRAPMINIGHPDTVPDHWVELR